MPPGRAWGYCTEFIISGTGLMLEDVRRYCDEMGRSTVVVGDDQNVRVHVHMEDPGLPSATASPSDRCPA